MSKGGEVSVMIKIDASMSIFSFIGFLQQIQRKKAILKQIGV